MMMASASVGGGGRAPSRRDTSSASTWFWDGNQCNYRCRLRVLKSKKCTSGQKCAQAFPPGRDIPSFVLVRRFTAHCSSAADGTVAEPLRQRGNDLIVTLAQPAPIVFSMSAQQPASRREANSANAVSTLLQPGQCPSPPACAGSPVKRFWSPDICPVLGQNFHRYQPAAAFQPRPQPSGRSNFSTACHTAHPMRRSRKERYPRGLVLGLAVSLCSFRASRDAASSAAPSSWFHHHGFRRWKTNPRFHRTGKRPCFVFAMRLIVTRRLPPLISMLARLAGAAGTSASALAAGFAIELASSMVAFFAAAPFSRVQFIAFFAHLLFNLREQLGVFLK